MRVYADPSNGPNLFYFALADAGDRVDEINQWCKNNRVSYWRWETAPREISWLPKAKWYWDQRLILFTDADDALRFRLVF